MVISLKTQCPIYTRKLSCKFSGFFLFAAKD